MFISRFAGRDDKAMMLLKNFLVKDPRDAKRILRRYIYISRSECEEIIRILKSQVNLEKICAFHWITIRVFSTRRSVPTNLI
jgi:hypothetical protein